MKKQITHISLNQSSKVFGLVYFILTALYCIPSGVYLLLTKKYDAALMLFIFPLFMFLMTYLSSVVVGFIYNKIASFTGGIEFELRDIDQ
jgi:hypothetical protein